MKNLNLNFRTDGSGYWSKASKLVLATCMELAYVNEDKDFGELRVYFNTGDWNVNEDGLIYTDNQWLDQFKNALYRLGYNDSDVYYSEQGMQGDNFVSLDVGEKFISSWA